MCDHDVNPILITLAPYVSPDILLICIPSHTFIYIKKKSELITACAPTRRTNFIFSGTDQSHQSQPKRQIHNYCVTKKNTPRRCAKAETEKKRIFFRSTHSHAIPRHLSSNRYESAFMKARTGSMRPRCGNVKFSKRQFSSHFT